MEVSNLLLPGVRNFHARKELQTAKTPPEKAVFLI